MVDSYLWGKAERVSSEAPVPIVSVINNPQKVLTKSPPLFLKKS